MIELQKAQESVREDQKNKAVTRKKNEDALMLLKDFERQIEEKRAYIMQTLGISDLDSQIDESSAKSKSAREFLSRIKSE